MATILLLLDAFRYDYLAEATTPFLWQCAQEGEYYVAVEQSMGFCERSEILTGKKGDSTGFFTAIGLDPANSPFLKAPYLGFLDGLEKLAYLLPQEFGAKIQRNLRLIVADRFRKAGISMPPYLIPYSWLPFFSLTEDLIDHRNPTAFKTPSILTLLERAGRTYCYDTFTALGFHSPYSSDSERLEAVIRDAELSPKDLYLIYIAKLDKCGHRMGPESPEFKKVLLQLDSELGSFAQIIKRKNPGSRFLFLGDHGMVSVKKKLDIENELNHMLYRAHLRKGQDFLYFLDSTMARFWITNESVQEVLRDMLFASEILNANGTWMNGVAAARNHVPWPDRRYGDFLWVANPGCIVFPDFFHRFELCKGMHGYDPTFPESRGMCINWGKGIPSNARPIMPLTYAFEILRRNLEL